MRIGGPIDREAEGAPPDQSFRCTIFNAAPTSGPSGLPGPQNKRYDCLTVAPPFSSSRIRLHFTMTFGDVLTYGRNHEHPLNASKNNAKRQAGGQVGERPSQAKFRGKLLGGFTYHPHLFSGCRGWRRKGSAGMGLSTGIILELWRD
ncbi:hypothetical protein NPIL_303811 [Nephila pilipes]|uniref:Uncharacterized protein n=1 Tax=Nephila pilipes TaxID=299642 RepID=A0A8X6N8E1_NEPPI|nr:hypothetical protein NPIL_303811 [Nephila pilipes]